jgi:YbbR domain-containing protein
MTSELIVIIFLLAFIVFLEVKNYHERKALTNKIMSKSYQEYAVHELEHQHLKRKAPRDEELVNI